jgi:glycosyltransferase involved in cell wall biosynthesis
MLASHLATIYNGINPDEFMREKDYRAARDRKEKWLLYAGNLSPSKGIHVLLDAFRLVLQRYPNVRLDIVGRNFSYPLLDMFDREDPALIASVKPWYAPHYAAHVKARLALAPKDAGSYGFRLKASLPPEVAAKVSFLDQLPHAELATRYADADVFVFPPLEAMAAGTPVVATCSGGIVETVRDGETGILVAKNDAPALAQAILQLLEDDALRERMGRTARAWALGHFTWDCIAERAYAMYKALSVPAPV